LYEAFCYVFVFCDLVFYWKTEARQKSGFLFGFLVLLFSVRIVVIKESQGGFESTLGLLSTGQWLSIPFIYRTVFSQLKTSKNLDLVLK
jgi:prolipoprotein diacylglyceryltransferase